VSVETEVRENLMGKLNQMRIAAMAGRGPGVDDLRLNVGRTRMPATSCPRSSMTTSTMACGGGKKTATGAVRVLR
jgi:hypothetical protein